MSDAVKTNTGAKAQKPKAAPAIKSAVPKARLVLTASMRQFVATPKIRGAMLLIVMMGFFSLLFFGMANTTYNKRQDAEIPTKRIALSDTVSGIEASNLVVGGIFNARREIVACLPIQYPVSQQIFKLLGKKAKDGAKVIVIMGGNEKNFHSAKDFLNHYGGGRIVVVGLPCVIYTTTILLDDTYAVKIGAPIGSSIGKAPICAAMEIYKNPARVREEKRIMAAMQGDGQG